jgi:hypothetical protein
LASATGAEIKVTAERSTARAARSDPDHRRENGVMVGRCTRHLSGV